MREQKRSSDLSAGKFVRFPKPVLRQLTAIANAERRTVSNTIRVLVEEALAARSASKAA